MADLSQPTNKTFKIRMLFDLSGGVGVIAGQQSYFQIWDEDNSLSAVYFRGAAGVQTPGIPFLKKLMAIISSGGLTDCGPWNTFESPAPLNVCNFSGLAMMIGAAAGVMDTSTSKAVLDLRSMSSRGNYHFVIHNFQTGETFQLAPSGQGTLGPFVIVLWLAPLNSGVFRYDG